MQARQNRIEQQASYMSAMLELERLIGVKPSSLQLPYLNQLPGLPATREQIRQTVWDSSQDLQILRKDVQSQAHVVASIYSRLLPTLSFNLEHDIGQNVRGTNPKQTDTRALGVMSWEMALGGKDLYAAHMAQAELAQRQSKLTEEADRLMQSVDADFALLQSTTLRIATGQAEQDAALMVLQSLQQQMKTGRVGSLLEALDANERYFGARMRLMQTLAQQMQAQAQLLRRLGVLSQLQSMVNQPVDINASMTRLKPPPEAVPSQLVKPETPSPSPSPTDLAPDATKDGVQVPAVPEPSAVSSQPIGALEPVQAPLQPLPAPNN
jgi:outer membrane protein TolC